MMIGFMQGRLTKSKDGKLQFFPWTNWENEFKLANKNKYGLIEWTIDSYKILNNPIFTQTNAIKKLCKTYNIEVNSVTCDFLMENPFYKDSKKKIDSLEIFEKLIDSCKLLSIKYIIFPLVDNGRIETNSQLDTLIKKLSKIESNLDQKVQILFETDFNPSDQSIFIKNFSNENFGINYDTGNSASNGYDCYEELDCYFDSIKNIHLKDRKYNSHSVPLGLGDFQFIDFFKKIKNKYNGNYILQTARLPTDSEIYNLNINRKYIEKVINEV